MHKDNPHQGRYNLDELRELSPELNKFLIRSPKGDLTIDFRSEEAVKALNASLLKLYYKVEDWQIPNNYLCPGVPGRVDYLFYINDLLAKPSQAKVLDIGTGANCIYPLVGASQFKWDFVATDIDELAVSYAKKNASSKFFTSKVDVRLQKHDNMIFKDVVDESEEFDAVICNPPFYRSRDEAVLSTRKKNTKLKIKGQRDTRNFGGMHKEVWCKGGERSFIGKMIFESSKTPKLATWFTTLVSQSDNVSFLKKELSKVSPSKVEVIDMEQGGKKTRILAWQF